MELQIILSADPIGRIRETASCNLSYKVGRHSVYIMERGSGYGVYDLVFHGLIKHK